MTTHDTQPLDVKAAKRLPLPLALPFPSPGRGLLTVYRELDKAINGDDSDRKALGNLDELPRPWIPATVTTPRLRTELWKWLEQVVDWINTEHVWETSTTIPPCWVLHPHLVHEIPVLADLRYRAGTALTSDPLEEWQHFTLPAFTDRFKARVRTMCEEDHKVWPARSRYNRYAKDHAKRVDAFERDAALLRTQPTEPDGETQPQLRLIDGHTVDTTTGEIHEP
ncbi:hypothetical protein [Ornithinimicrobium murale]|uniref:hypothetical protein n=1 Tax=Ornithinimicrobium murale TaxID=1050153 RepID=UPI000E0E0750|nr:hypothetical protein [Ornithinimicrobium murale]